MAVRRAGPAMGPAASLLGPNPSGSPIGVPVPPVSTPDAALAPMADMPAASAPTPGRERIPRGRLAPGPARSRYPRAPGQAPAAVDLPGFGPVSAPAGGLSAGGPASGLPGTGPAGGVSGALPGVPAMGPQLQGQQLPFPGAVAPAPRRGRGARTPGPAQALPARALPPLAGNFSNRGPQITGVSPSALQGTGN